MSTPEQKSSVKQESTTPKTPETEEIRKNKADLQEKLSKIAEEHGAKVLSVQMKPQKPQKDKHSLPLNPIEPIKAVGKERTTGKEYEEAIKSNSITKAWESIEAMRDEANTDKIMPEEQIKAVLEEAHQNPVTKNLIEEARKLTIENSESIHKQLNDLVALYNVKQDKAFFFVTSAEARLAIDYIKRCRDGHMADLKDLEAQDDKIHRLMKQLPSMGLVTDIKDIMKGDSKTISDLHKDLVDMCWEAPEAEIMDRRGNLSVDNGLFFSTLYGYQDLDKRIELLESAKSNGAVEKVYSDKDSEEVKVFPEFMVYDYEMDICGGNYSASSPELIDMTLSSLNQLFSVIESHDLTVDVLIMNAKNIATIRNWGKTVHDQYPKQEFVRRKVYGKIFTSEIYLCNWLKGNQILAGSLGIKPHGIFLNALFK